MPPDDPTPMGRAPLSEADNEAFWAAAHTFLLAMVNRPETLEETVRRTQRQVSVERSTLEATLKDQDNAPGAPRRRL